MEILACLFSNFSLIFCDSFLGAKRRRDRSSETLDLDRVTNVSSCQRESHVRVLVRSKGQGTIASCSV